MKLRSRTIEYKNINTMPAKYKKKIAKNSPVKRIKTSGNDRTTSLGFMCKDGIIVASCSPKSTRTTSNFVGIDPYMLCTRVGDPVDKLFWKQCCLYEAKHKRRMPVNLAALLVQDMMKHFYGPKFPGAVFAGWELHGPDLFFVDHEYGPVNGNFSVGSKAGLGLLAMIDGSSTTMTAMEAISFGRWAIRRAAFQDGVLDGVSEVYYVGPNGWEPMLYDDVLIAGLYKPISVHLVDQEEPTNEDSEWMDCLQSLEKYQKEVLPSV